MRADPKRWPSVSMIALLCALTLVAFDGCAGARSQPRNEPPIMSEYKGWTISVSPSHQTGNSWRAGVRVWPPEVRPETHPGINVRFGATASDRRAIEQAGIVAARRYIDASVPVTQQ
jgi:hypothetical protein